MGPVLGTQWSLDAPNLSDNFSLVWTAMAETSPTLDVSPVSRDFGRVPVGSSEDRTFTVQNIGSGVVRGNATTSAPFRVVSGGSYALSMGQSQRVIVRLSPTSTGTLAGHVSFDGPRSITRAVTGTGIAVSPSAPSGLTAARASARYPSAGLSPNTTYVYRLRTCNAVGCSDYSNEATATTSRRRRR